MEPINHYVIMKQKEMKQQIKISQDGMERLAKFLITGNKEVLKP